MSKLGDRYQIALIALGIAATLLYGYFFYKEFFPEYKIFQNDYIALEEFRSSYSKEPPPAFSKGIKQLVFERADKGPEKIDRCTSCHIAVQMPHFSSTKIKRDSLGNVVTSEDGTPVKVPNDDYVWAKLDTRIKELTSKDQVQELNSQEKKTDADERLKETYYLESLKTAKIGEHEYDVVKVLSMHPLIGKETRAFELHPLEEYGCTSCHSGNGRALTIDKAHGPVFDGFYEEEFTGRKPKFIEEDKNNDPRFSKVFNHKPGDSLLFQTSPILPGNLIQASCIACHGNTFTPKNNPLEKTSLKSLTISYTLGEELFISQACYACHKIAGVARGGAGPDLTFAGNLYPWYLKESIVWPQADLPTSTMPNFHLDPEWVEDLMTYLLAQKGQSKKIAEIDYKVWIQKWEGGEKLKVEKAIPPSKIEDLSYSMTVFAAEGCASCHRLQGFESDVGFTVEKDDQSPFESRQWFKSLFYEEIPGTEIARLIEKHESEINKKILNNVRINSILEKIHNEYPELPEAFYQNFHYAKRAKNHIFKDLEKKAANPKELAQITEQQKEWQDLVQRVLMIYIQEYGLGRLIGPKLNWSGIYRSDEWLMEHFKNPASHVPKSLMPVFPFDENKFYALTYMLDVLGKRNQRVVQTVWEHQGFNPESAYAIFCSQCHGQFLQGDGPVSQWIYPIPKNLRSAEFLKHLTREEAAQSITHGVLGTPMAPWGETKGEAKGGTVDLKPSSDIEPVLSKDQIHTLVDWLFTTLPGSASINTGQDTFKWKYQPKDVIDELKASHSFKNLNKGTNNAEASAKDELSVFDVVPNSGSLKNENSYFISNKYYTEKNIASGEQFFDLNCASCHGSDADGSGIRASIMNDAKPRMLTNLDWLASHDDMYLLRSIKYGVPGTAMTPWGDLTSSLQRIQLVIFIRSLSAEKEKRVSLQKALYAAFDLALKGIDKARMKEYPELEKLESKYDLANQQIKESFELSQKIKKPLKSDLVLYQSNVELNNLLITLKARDQLYVDLKTKVAKQKDQYQAFGNDMINAGVDPSIWIKFLKILELVDGRFQFLEGNLIMQPIEKTQKSIQKLESEVAASLKAKKNSDDKPSPNASVFEKLEIKLRSTLAVDQQLLSEEAVLYEALNNENKKK